jgi:hypothetical protein
LFLEPVFNRRCFTPYWVTAIGLSRNFDAHFRVAVSQPPTLGIYNSPARLKSTYANAYEDASLNRWRNRGNGYAKIWPQDDKSRRPFG